jgi:hypothetical protein
MIAIRHLAFLGIIRLVTRICWRDGRHLSQAVRAAGAGLDPGRPVGRRGTVARRDPRGRPVVGMPALPGKSPASGPKRADAEIGGVLEAP